MQPESVMAELREDGIAVIPALVPGPLCEDAIRWLSALPRYSDHRTETLYPHVRGTNLQPAADIMALPAMREIRRLFPGSYISDIIGIQSRPGPEPVADWHVDASNNPARYRIKAYFYLTETTPENGAFAYVSGSHLTIPAAAKQAGRRLHVLEDIATAWPVPWLDNPYDPLERHAIEGPAGTLILFDERGLHSGGVVSSGERQILRVSLAWRDWSDWKEWARAGRNALLRYSTPNPVRVLL